MIFAVVGFIALILAVTIDTIASIQSKKTAEHFEQCYRGAEKEIGLLFNNVSSLSIQIATQKERIDMLEDSNKELKGKLENAEAHVAAQVAEKVEKRWDAGLEKMMAWNPYDIGNGDGGN